MRQIKTWTQYYVNWLTRLGIIRFSLLLALFIIVMAVTIQIGVTMLLRGTVDIVDIVRSVFFGLLVTPWAAYFLTAVVDELEDSRQRLTHMVSKLQEMRERDQALNVQLQNNISQLNQQIEETYKAESARQQAMSKLKAEVVRREQAQQELEERSVLLLSFIDSSPDLIFYRNEQGIYSGCNHAMEALIGIKERQLIGLRPEDVYSPEIAAKVLETDQEVYSRNTPCTYEQWMTYPDGHSACFEMRKVPFFDARGKRLGLLGFGRDVTERQRHQQQLEQASREKTTFISTISHELRTPLNGIVGLSRILQETRLDAEQRQYLNTIHVSAVTLGNIFNDIIDLDKLDRHRLQIAPMRVDLPAFLSDLESLTRLMAEQKGLYLHFDLDGELPHWVLADGTRLRQVLWNLTGNAIKFTEHGGVTLRVYMGTAEHRHLTLRFEVEDTGIGIAPEHFVCLFSAFEQANASIAREYGGSGLGLVITRHLARLMGGEAGGRSEPGVGSTFWFTVWLGKQGTELNDGSPNVSLHAAEEVLRRDHAGRRILLVDDDENNRDLALEIFEPTGLTVDMAFNGMEAIEMAGETAYDLILMDMRMPHMDGLEATRMIRRLPEHARTPILAMTGNTFREDKEECLESGMDDFIPKPVRLEELYTKLLEWLPKSGQV